MQNTGRQKGSVIVYAVFCIMALLALMTLSIDWGREQLAKTEMRRIADSIATYSVTGIVDSTYLSKATQAALDNKCSDSNAVIALQAGDVVAGLWNSSTKAFTAGGATPNAVKVTVVRTAARGNPLRLFFGQAIGRSTADITVSSVATLDGAMADGTYNIGWVGLGSTNLSTTGRVDAYASSKAVYAFPGSEASIGSNGTHNINGNTAVNGNVLYGPSGGISTNPPAVISGDRTKLNQNFSFAPYAQPGYTTSVSGSGYTLSGGNLTINNGGTVNFPAGFYSFGTITVNAGGTLNITATGNNTTYIYVNNLTFNGRQTNNGTAGAGVAYNMILLMNGGGFNVNAQTDLYGLFYGPNTPANISGSGSLFGFGIFSSLNVGGSVSLHHDLSLGQILTTDANKNISAQWPPNPSAAGRSIIVK